MEIKKWLLLTITMLPLSQAELMDRMRRVKESLFSDYDRRIRPTNGTNTTEVYTAFIPRQILGLDEEKSIFSLDSFFFMHWYDARLRWNSSDYDGFLQLPRELLWVPDINVYNSHSVQVDPTNEVLLLVHYSGTVSWFPPILTQTSCASNSATPYPNDEIDCPVILGSWVHDGWEINFLHSMDFEWDEFANTHTRWELVQSKSYIERKEDYYECCPEPYVSIHAHFPLKRRPPPEIEATRAPCILTMALTLSIFWLPPSKRLLMGGLLFLALNGLLIYVACSTRQPLAVWNGVSFLRAAMYILVTCILLEVFVTLKIASLPGRPPARLVHLLTGPVGKYLLLLWTPEQPVEQVQLTSGEGADEEWKMFAAALDRVFFLIMLFVMIVVHHL